MLPEKTAEMPVETLPTPGTDRVPVAPADLEGVLAEIARDVRVEPEAYLDQTRVPGGGE